MARINLLPWRAERAAQRQKEFMAMIGLAVLAGAALWFLVNGYYNAQIEGQQARNAFMDQQIAQVDETIKEIEELDRQRARLLARKEVIEELQASRSQMVHLFDALVRTIPDGVMLTTLKQEGDRMTLEGRAQSNARVSTYMRNLEGAGWMANPQLTVIEAQPEGAGVHSAALPYVFNLSVTLSTPSSGEDGEPDGQDAADDGEAATADAGSGDAAEVASEEGAGS
ncbi:PilN domain-containing protein [Luteimonas sp. JM171]|uniref:PilN domain-containing protein n=1 Tax=Luteimonas sp. JM171 TaxID=1896164 RepID=UPI000858FCE9|nr:fimbrial protein [Luteimonas sp. JM171]